MPGILLDGAGESNGGQLKRGCYERQGADAALELARSAADLEDSTDKHPVTPGAIVPARDLLGQMLLELDRPREAHIEFTTVLAAEPNRFGALYGSARSAERSGDITKAREFYAALVTVAPQSRRQEVRHTRLPREPLKPGD